MLVGIWRVNNAQNITCNWSLLQLQFVLSLEWESFKYFSRWWQLGTVSCCPGSKQCSTIQLQLQFRFNLVWASVKLDRLTGLQTLPFGIQGANTAQLSSAYAVWAYSVWKCFGKTGTFHRTLDISFGRPGSTQCSDIQLHMQLWFKLDY